MVMAAGLILLRGNHTLRDGDTRLLEIAASADLPFGLA